MSKYSLGLDYGTNSVRALIVEVTAGREVGTAVWNYEHGEAGILLDAADPNLARQHPDDYVKGIGESVRGAMRAAAANEAKFFPADIVGIGVDTTGSTPLPVDEVGEPLIRRREFAGNPDAMAWLWKDHTAHAEAARITELTAELRPNYLAKCGGTFSSEWFCRRFFTHTTPPRGCSTLRTPGWRSPTGSPRCSPALRTPASLEDASAPPVTRPCSTPHGAVIRTKNCCRRSIPLSHGSDARCRTSPMTSPIPWAGLSAQWAERLGLRAGIPVAAGAFDAHLGAVGSGIQPGVLVKILGTSSCDMAVAPLSQKLPDIPGLCGIVPESILPGCYGLEAGQSAVGDIFNWYVNRIQPRGAEAGSHQALTGEAERLRPGESGLLALDWHNGNRTILVDQRLTGLILGMTLHTQPAEVYRAWIEATAFGARVIAERFEEYGVRLERVVNCGGISVKNPMVMQIYADVMNRPLEISRSAQTCALGAAMAGAVAAGPDAGGHANFAAAAGAMTGVLGRPFKPIPSNVAVYDRLYRMYRRLHDLFGTKHYTENQYALMKELLDIRDGVRNG